MRMRIFTAIKGCFFKASLAIMFLLICFSAHQLYAGNPSMVLDGTNVKSLNEYRFSRFEPKAGEYETETGGTEIRLVIRKKGKTFQVYRHYSEPGMTPQARVYNNFKRGKGDVFQTRGARLKVTDKGGILLLELSSGVDAITDSMWTYFEPKKQGE